MQFETCGAVLWVVCCLYARSSEERLTRHRVLLTSTKNSTKNPLRGGGNCDVFLTIVFLGSKRAGLLLIPFLQW